MLVWLPFYDLGAGVGKNQPNHPMDVKLFLFLCDRIQSTLRTSGFLYRGQPMPPIAASGDAGQRWMEFLYAFCKTKGYAASMPAAGQMFVKPQHSDSTSFTSNSLKTSSLLRS